MNREVSTSMEKMYKLLVIFVAVCFSKAHDPLPDDLSKEMYCAGCKATVKELGRALQFHTSEKMETRVENLLEQVCDEERFLSYEYSPKKLVKACEHLRQNHQDDLVPLLKDYFSKKSRKGHSYLHIAHIVCNKETFACEGGEEEEHDPKKGKVVYNDDTDNFDIHFGDNVKMVKPIKEFASPKRDEL